MMLFKKICPTLIARTLQIKLEVRSQYTQNIKYWIRVYWEWGLHHYVPLCQLCHGRIKSFVSKSNNHKFQYNKMKCWTTQWCYCKWIPSVWTILSHSSHLWTFSSKEVSWHHIVLLFASTRKRFNTIYWDFLSLLFV